MKNNLIYLFLLLLLTSCEKENIVEGIQTNVSGKITDYYDSPITNAKVKIGEFKNRFVSDGGSTDYFHRYIDSTLTNSSGDYFMTFKTTGEGTSYKLIIENSPSDQSYFGLFDSIEIANLGNSFIFDCNQFTKLYPCDVTINLNNISTLPIYIWHDTTAPVNSPAITTNNTIVKRIYIDKFLPQTISFGRTKPNGVNQKAVFTFPASNSDSLTLQNITLNESDFLDI